MSQPIEFTKQQIRFIKANRLKMSGADIARQLGVPKNRVTKWLFNNGLQIPAALREKFRKESVLKHQLGKTIVSKEDDLFIMENYLDIPVKTLGEWLGYGGGVIARRLKQLGLKIPVDIIAERKRMTMFEKGMIPKNKGKKMPKYMYEICKKNFFKKGHIPATGRKYKIGTIIIRHDHKDRSGRKYKMIKANRGKLQFLHVYKWENKYGKIPKGFCLWFKDGDTMNCNLRNIELITRAENMRRNSIQRLPEELKEVIYLKTTIKRKLNEHKKRQSASAEQKHS